MIYEGQSGALNESYADVFGALIDRGNWTIGEAVIKSPPFPVKFLRSLEDPNGGNYDVSDPLNSVGQPAHMNEYADLPYTRKGDNGGVHYNSGVQNFFFYLLCEGGSGDNDGITYNVTGIGIANAERVAYRALTVYCTASTDYQAVRSAWMSAAQDLNPSWVTPVAQAWSAVGINAHAALRARRLEPSRAQQELRKYLCF